jgi:hypothetical protein
MQGYNFSQQHTDRVVNFLEIRKHLQGKKTERLIIGFNNLSTSLNGLQ